jgi:hypothetical protein
MAPGAARVGPSAHDHAARSIGPPATATWRPAPRASARQLMIMPLEASALRRRRHGARRRARRPVSTDDARLQHRVLRRQRCARGDRPRRATTTPVMPASRAGDGDVARSRHRLCRRSSRRDHVIGPRAKVASAETARQRPRVPTVGTDRAHGSIRQRRSLVRQPPTHLAAHHRASDSAAALVVCVTRYRSPESRGSLWATGGKNGLAAIARCPSEGPPSDGPRGDQGPSRGLRPRDARLSIS